MDPLRALAAALVPQLCSVCGGPCRRDERLCRRCKRALAAIPAAGGSPPPAVDALFSAATHDGVAGDLVVALKFRRLLPVAELMAERIALHAPPQVLAGDLVPVPAAPLRLLRRGFDPAAELAAALGRRLGRRPLACMARHGNRRQVGRGRAGRLEDPPRVSTRGAVPRDAVLVDDVVTTGATLTACARALRRGGADRVTAATFTRRV